jgi:hypothetical protein
MSLQSSSSEWHYHWKPNSIKTLSLMRTRLPHGHQLPNTLPRSVPSTNVAIPWSSTTGTRQTRHVTISANVPTELRTDSSVPQTLNSIPSKTYVTGHKISQFAEEWKHIERRKKTNQTSQYFILLCIFQLYLVLASHSRPHKILTYE